MVATIQHLRASSIDFFVLATVLAAAATVLLGAKDLIAEFRSTRFRSPVRRLGKGK